MPNDNWQLTNEIRADLVPVLRALTRAIEKLAEPRPAIQPDPDVMQRAILNALREDSATRDLHIGTLATLAMRLTTAVRSEGGSNQ